MGTGLQRMFTAVLFGLVTLRASACNDSAPRKCGNAPETPDKFCFCSEGESCSQSCPASETGCTLGCFNQNRDCSLEAQGNECIADCQSATRCTVDCGNEAHVACQYVTDTCTAIVGDGADVNCEGANDCEITCKGPCNVMCLSDGRCRVACHDPATCSVTCMPDSSAPLCPDGITKTCGTPC